MKGRSLQRRLTAAALLAALWLCCEPCRGQAHTNILLVYEDRATIPAFLVMENALFHRLHELLDPRPEVYEEQIDSVRFHEQTEERIAELRSRYANRNIHAVIYVGNVAHEILPHVPTVFVTNLLNVQAQLNVFHAPVRTVWTGVDPRNVVVAAGKLQPGARRVLLISGSAQSDLAYLDQLQTGLKDMKPAFEIEAAANETVDQLVNRVARLPRNTIAIFTSYSGDPAGNYFIPRDVASKLAAASSVPIYAVSDSYVGAGAVGGYVVNWAKTGNEVANSVAKMLKGEPPDQGLTTSEYMFDWRQMQRWGFSESDLPPGSIVEFKSESLWEHYRWRIVGAIAVIIGQFLLIGGLLIHRYRRKLAEKSLRDMAGKLLRTQDEERRRVARELHDGTGQHLSGIALSLGQVLADFPPGHEHLRHLLQDSYAASRQALDEVRAVSYALHPPMLDGMGLVPALRWYLDGLQKRTNLRVDLEAPAELAGATVDAERTIFRVVQESVTNVLRHSGGSALKVKLGDGGKGITLEIEDNGHGMTAEELQHARGAVALGVGIAGMRERVQQLHGTFDINSNAHGTRVSVSLPAEAESYAAHSAG
jgi:signal transduction histidine kinase